VAPLTVGARGSGDLRRVIDRMNLTLAGWRDRTIILLGFGAALRRSEIVGLDVEDLRWTTEADGGTGVVLKLRSTKSGRFKEVHLPEGTTELCPVRALRLWLEISKLTAGPLFRPLTRNLRQREVRLTDRSVAEIVKKRVRAAGLDARQFSGHSLRAGFLTSAAGQGASLTDLAKFARHKDPRTTMGYVRGHEGMKRYPGKGMV
jgi:integrase